MRTQHPRHGISLLEVLAAIFVLSIGLLGVLAVIPFGAFQVSKANHAEYASNMLANAAEEIAVRQMLDQVPTNNPATFVWVEPYQREPVDQLPIAFASIENWTEMMRGQDDLLYTAHGDRRPDFPADKVQSSGKYTWFFTFQPTGADGNVSVDVLACYNRVPTDDAWLEPGRYHSALGGGTFIFYNPPDKLAERLSQTKYVLATWTRPSGLAGAWCRIVFLDNSRPANPSIVVTGDLPTGEGDYDNMQVYIPNGVLYWKNTVVRR
ncbi:MAG: prepilin-type N-terminal cleavage/methylation domain-containing protein [Planctomycetaceae bacterium]|nr:prepilin-type N-terminal cleavage/methylation domain-containing protein [Planctomycetaceae bacterium]